MISKLAGWLQPYLTTKIDFFSRVRKPLPIEPKVKAPPVAIFVEHRDPALKPPTPLKQ